MTIFRKSAVMFKRLLHRRNNVEADVSNTQASLGVLGIPAHVGLCAAGRVSVLLVRDVELGHRCALRTAHNLRQTGPLVMLAAGASGQQFMDRFAGLDNSRKSSHKKPAFFSITDNCAEMIGQLGTKRFFDELKACGVTARHAVLIQAGQTIFDWQNHAVLVRQWQAWKNWAARRHSPVVLILEDINGAHGLLPLLRTLPGLVTNLAVLDANGSGGLLTIEHWGAQNKHIRRQFGLKRSARDEFLHSDGSEMDATGLVVLDAPDQGLVIATAGAVAGAKGVPAEWKVVPDLSAMETACHGAVAATILLHADGDREFEALAQFVHRMRLSHLRALKIVVRETGDKLRYNNELVLLRLGANTVVYKEIPFSRLLHMIDDMVEQTFSRPVEDEYLLALQAAEPNRVTGYLAPSPFCREVAAMLKRAERIGLGHTLLRLPLLSRVAQLDALQACQARRFGDIFTADQHHVYLFLFACREPDVDLTLDRIFSVPVAELFSSIIIEPTSELIWEVVSQLQRGNEDSLMPDYSAMLQASLSARDDKTEHLIATTGYEKEAEAEEPYSPLSPAAKKVAHHEIKRRVVRLSPLPRRGGSGILSTQIKAVS